MEICNEYFFTRDNSRVLTLHTFVSLSLPSPLNNTYSHGVQVENDALFKQNGNYFARRVESFQLIRRAG